ncbi:hypothetical protein Dimus_028216 [Dionaea muscipula]
MELQQPVSLLINIFNMSNLSKELSKPTFFFHIKLWIFILISTSLVIVLILLILLLLHCIADHRLRRRRSNDVVDDDIRPSYASTSSMDRRLLLSNFTAAELEIGRNGKWEFPPAAAAVIHPHHHEPLMSAGSRTTAASARPSIKRNHSNGTTTWCNEYSLKEILDATRGWDNRYFIWNEDNGISFHGVLFDGTRVMINKLLHLRVGAEEFKTELVERIQRLTHKNVAKPIGYCVESDNRILVYEYIGNGNLHQWLHGYDGSVTPLPWCLRIDIVRGIAKALEYLHEAVEPKVVHGAISSTNIFLDHQWNPKISNIGVARLIAPEFRQMAEASSGYTAPGQDDCIGVVQPEKADVYSFGILLMEIICGRPLMDYSKPQGEVNIVEWLKCVVSTQAPLEQVLDRKIVDVPPLKELKRLLLIAFKCADPDAQSRPKMGQVIHMLEPRDLLLHNESHTRQETLRPSYSQGSSKKISKVIEDDPDTTEAEEGSQATVEDTL